MTIFYAHKQRYNELNDDKSKTSFGKFIKDLKYQKILWTIGLGVIWDLSMNYYGVVRETE